MRFQSFFWMGLALATITGCQSAKQFAHEITVETQPAIVGSDKVVIWGIADASGSVNKEERRRQADRIVKATRPFREAPLSQTYLYRLANQSEQFYEGASHAPNIADGLTKYYVDADGYPNGTNLAPLLNYIEGEIEGGRAGKKGALQFIFVGTDGGFTDNPANLQAISEKLAKQNVYVVISGISSKPHQRLIEICRNGLAPLRKAGKLCLIQESAEGPGFAAMMNQLATLVASVK